MSAGKNDGRTTRWDQHRVARRAEFVQAAVRAIDTLGPDASIADIAAEAGVSKPVLYRYFADKGELHAAVGSWGAELILERVVVGVLAPATARERVTAGVAAYLDTLAEHPQAFLLLARHHAGGDDPLAHGKNVIAAQLARMLGDALRRLGGDAGAAEPWAHAVVGLGASVGQWWLERRTMSRAAIADYLGDFIWHALSGTAAEQGIDLSSLDLPADVTPIRSGRQA
ncbi:TetR/AcrR family transcriptional regulator [Pimelobacter simplex]|uniref:TetR/AcrR family transcriptional regulator n=1 Tax=Nocardioides simplex TaxID=2045 RepID=A0A4Y3MXE5_NOCSI|nr:TetR family transcriptional regulator [Pimelobacter simplex]KAB2811802.1 TetR/AcrR family transcriptional regulator [Pimelobacter simplex]MCG8153354.1 TetR family transcriptional regulator [Pimelobacter simplex]GEB14114.1 TetR family transcriptional regulator [Pimelobacter simplex]SFM33644.1 transcriptional regulator, TetR family [Pimelobacter simplex]